MLVNGLHQIQEPGIRYSIDGVTGHFIKERKLVWILMSSVNDYNQHGMYFERFYADKPDVAGLMEFNRMTEQQANDVLIKAPEPVMDQGDSYYELCAFDAVTGEEIIWS